MKKFTVISLASLAAAISFVGCNSSSSSSFEYETSANVAINSFKLAQDDSIIANLDTVFFAIDLNRGEIFNADSLPYGTVVNKLVPKIVTYANASKLTVTDKLDNGTDSIHDYLTNPGDSINFANGPVFVDVTSADGSASMRYTVNVNVHKVVSDTLSWDRTAWRTLPTSLKAPVAQRTARTSAGFYCLSTDASGAWAIAFTGQPDKADSWTIARPLLPARADINSFNSSNKALYILADEGNNSGKTLYTSTDGINWTSTQKYLHSLYGAYGDEILACRIGGAGVYESVSYPSMKTVALPDGMPLEETSLPVVYKTPLALDNIAVMLGGISADGSRSSDAWAYDGSAWARISSQGLPEGLSGMMIAPFYVFHTNELFVATEFSVLLGFGGNNGKENNDDVFISYDWGMTWAKAQDYLQLPDFVPAVQNGQAFVFNTTMTANARSAAWTEIARELRLPAGVDVISATELMSVASRATKPITSWECPFIYMFGGYDANGKLNNAVWRATINRLQFRPIQ